MSFKLNAITGTLDLVGASVSTESTTNIPEFTSDPVSPDPQAAWVLRQGSSGTVTGGGQLFGIMGLSTFLVTAGVGSGSSYTYQLSYRTLEGTTKRVSLS